MVLVSPTAEQKSLTSAEMSAYHRGDSMDTRILCRPLLADGDLSPFSRKTEDAVPPLFVKRLAPAAVLPTRANPGDAGYDLTSVESVFLTPGQRQLVSTGISMAIPTGHYGRVAPRSGLAVKMGLGVGAGVIDVSFRGEVKVLLINHGERDVVLPSGSRIAQLIIERISTPCVIEVEELDATKRGSGGFGSTGMGTLSLPKIE